MDRTILRFPVAVLFNSSASYLLFDEIMRDLCIKTKSTQHATELFVDVETLDVTGVTVENDVKCFISLFGNSCGKSKAVARTHWNDTNIHGDITCCIGNLVHC